MKFPGNKDQYLVYADIQDALVQSTDLLKQDDVAGTLSTLETTQKSLRQRRKKIKLADKSEASWLAVKEYEADELASVSEEEKRIRKAQATPLRKKNQSRQQRSSSQPNKATPSYCFNASIYTLVCLCICECRRKMFFLRANAVSIEGKCIFLQK